MTSIGDANGTAAFELALLRPILLSALFFRLPLRACIYCKVHASSNWIKPKMCNEYVAAIFAHDQTVLQSCTLPLKPQTGHGWTKGLKAIDDTLLAEH